ncbi:DUF3515 family protein [Nocardia sp. NPDC024068]|uniref:DUF3515 domain-containing protein n=1 Tax=Nocardia sp. NPDC024068 TaxID=3157197 RepID=UPI003408988B
MPGTSPDRDADSPEADGSVQDNPPNPGAAGEPEGPGVPDAPETEPPAVDAPQPNPEGRREPESTGVSGEPENVADTGATGDTEGAGDADNGESGRTPYPPALIATAVALPVALLVGVVVAAVLVLRAPAEPEPVALGPVPAPAADGPACTTLMPALPADMGDFTRASLVEPVPPATMAWQRPDGGEPIVLRCGLDRPLEFNRASALQIVNGVQWFEIRDDAAATATWFAVDRETYIALTVPDGSGPTPLQAVSDTITAQLPARPIDPGELPN